MQRGGGGRIRTIPTRSYLENWAAPIVSELCDRPKGDLVTGRPVRASRHPGHDVDNQRSARNTSSPSRTHRVRAPAKKCVVTSASCTDTRLQVRLKSVLRRIRTRCCREMPTWKRSRRPDIAETGTHLRDAAHNSAVQTINRIIDVFPPHQQPQCAPLSFTLEGSVPDAPARARARAGDGVEIMIPNAAIRT